jgi:hypothetical protein
MDQVTQSNAATSEESAAAAEELSSQSEQLRLLVHQLENLVNGADGVNENEPRATPPTPRADAARSRQRFPSGDARQDPWREHRQISLPSTRPAQVIPLDELENRAEFADFSSNN